MRRWKRFLLTVAPVGLLGYAISVTKASDPVPVANDNVAVSGLASAPNQDSPKVDKDITLTQAQPSQSPTPPSTDLQSTPQQAPTSSLLSTAQSVLGTAGGQSVSPNASAGQVYQSQTVPAYNSISGEQSVGLAATDTGDLLSKSASATGVSTQKRSPIVNESHIRGFNLGEITTQSDGVYWLPARPDLDTFLSKIDSGEIKDLLVIKGPYSALYGPVSPSSISKRMRPRAPAPRAPNIMVALSLITTRTGKAFTADKMCRSPDRGGASTSPMGSAWPTTTPTARVTLSLPNMTPAT